MAAFRPSSALMTFSANCGVPNVVTAREGGRRHGVRVGHGEGVGRRVNTGVQWHLRGGGEIPVDMTAVEVDDRHHLGGDGGQVGSRGGYGDQVPLARGDVARRADDQPLLGQVATRARHGFPGGTQK